MRAREKKAMVGWFDPIQLIRTAIRVVISTLFGAFADKREAFAAANPIDDGELDPPCNYAKRYPDGDFWFDYVADTGDGWNPTYAIALLLAKKDLFSRAAQSDPPRAAEPGLPRGRLLIMGGDQVYPTASREEYDNRLVYPYDEAYRPEGATEGCWPESNRPDLFAVPGNHDWYDGLNTFFHLFCRRTIKTPGQAEVSRRGGVIGGRQTHQTRSYFALKLPHGWWLWGTDNQLEGYIDQPQVDFFQFVAESWMERGSKLILCTGTPDWEYVDPNAPEKKFSTLSYLERLAPAVKDKGHQLKLVLSGDSHHYARFQEEGLNYITCGGGGAFLHPTHKLERERKFQFEYPRPGMPYDPDKAPYDRCFTIAAKAGTKDEEALFPSRPDSRGLAAGNLLFPLTNWKFTLTLLPVYFLFTWLLDFNVRVFYDRGLATWLQPRSFWDGVYGYWQLVLSSPWPALLCAIAWGGYVGFANAKSRVGKIALGSGHALIQAMVVTAATTVVIQSLPNWTGFWGIAGTLLVASLTSALFSAFVFGLYLWFCLSAFGIHRGHFSSLAVQGYKSFLRLHIDGAGKLNVYPVGLTRVPSDRGRAPGAPPPELEPHLIETVPPIS